MLGDYGGFVFVLLCKGVGGVVVLLWNINDDVVKKVVFGLYEMEFMWELGLLVVEYLWWVCVEYIESATRVYWSGVMLMFIVY